MVDYDEENDKDIFGGLDDDQIEAHRESRPSIFQLNNNFPSAPFPEEFVQQEDKDAPEIKIEEGSENKNIDHHQNLNGNSKNLYDIGETIKPLSSKDNIKEEEKIPKPQKSELDKPEANEQKEKEKENKKDIPKIEKEKMEKTFMSKYISEDKQNYVICIEETKEIIIISISNEKENDSPFTSKYELYYLIEKFGKNINFKSIQEFRACLKENVQKQLLIIKRPYKNVINTIWKLYPNNAKEKKTFTLIIPKLGKKSFIIFLFKFQKSRKSG